MMNVLVPKNRTSYHGAWCNDIRGFYDVISGSTTKEKSAQSPYPRGNKYP
jgi:hypothetical protein